MKNILLGTISIVTVVFFVGGVSLAAYRVFGPPSESVRRQVFEETKSYRDGTRSDFDNLYVQYQAAHTQEEKLAILSVIRHRTNHVPRELIPEEIRNVLHGGEHE